MESNSTEGESPKKLPLKKQLSFDEKVTEISLALGDMENNSKRNRKQSVGWWTASEKNHFACYCKTTSVHGLQYVGNDGQHLGERILWGVVFIISLLSAIWLIKAVFVKYYDSPVILTFQASETLIGDLPFPAITICNMNRVRKSEANRYMELANGANENDITVQHAREDVYYLDHVCRTSNTPFSKMFNYSMKRGSVDPELLKKVHLRKEQEGVWDVRNFLRKAAQPCEEMLQLCWWEGDVLDCKKNFRPIETNFGQCCVFNMVPHTLLYTFTEDKRDTASLLDKWKDYEENIMFETKGPRKASRRPRRQNRAGKSSGFMFLADPALHEYFCTSSDSTGFRLSVHSPMDIPHVTDFGIAIRPNYEHFISVTPEVVVADSDIRSYSIEKRNCYFEGEYSLKYYNYYSMSNCLDECVANQTFETCNCVRYYMPRDDVQDICSPANFSCAETVRQNLFKSGVKQMCKECLPTCNDIRFSASATMAPLQRLNLWVDDEKNTSAQWATSDVSIVHVYYGQDSTHAKVRGQLYGITDLIANTGGLLGLCMGFSMLSLVEVIYHLTLRPLFRNKEFKTRLPKESQTPGEDGNKVNGTSTHSQAESRRVNMKPGDDGRYHLQNASCTSLPSYNTATAISISGNETPGYNTYNEIGEDSRL